MPICQALLKHGYENFSISILEYCEVKDLMDREGYYFNLLWDADISRYNISKDPTAPFAGRKHSLETLKAMSEAQTGENNPMFGLTGEKHHRFCKPRAEGAGRWTSTDPSLFHFFVILYVYFCKIKIILCFQLRRRCAAPTKRPSNPLCNPLSVPHFLYI